MPGWMRKDRHSIAYRITMDNDDTRWNYWIFIIAVGGYSRGNSHSIFNRN